MGRGGSSRESINRLEVLCRGSAGGAESVTETDEGDTREDSIMVMTTRSSIRVKPFSISFFRIFMRINELRFRMDRLKNNQ